MQRPTNLSILEHPVQEQCVISNLLTAVTVVSSCYCTPSSLLFNHFSSLPHSSYQIMASQWTWSHCSIWLGGPSGHVVWVSCYLTKYTSQSLIIDAGTNLLWFYLRENLFYQSWCLALSSSYIRRYELIIILNKELFEVNFIVIYSLLT